VFALLHWNMTALHDVDANDILNNVATARDYANAVAEN
jgi:hypothetical protein